MIVPPNVFKLAKLTSTENTRYGITGVQFERQNDECFAAATDGRMLGYVRWQDRELRDEFPCIDGDGSCVKPVEGFSCLVDRDHCREAEKAIPKKRMTDRKPILRHALLNEQNVNGTVTLVTTDLERNRKFTQNVMEGSFPRWREILPQYKRGVESASIAVNPEKLRQILEVAEAFTDATAPSVRLEIPLDQSGPLIVTPLDGGMTSAEFLLLPISDTRTTCKNSTYPSARIDEILKIIARCRKCLSKIGPANPDAIVFSDIEKLVKNLSPDVRERYFNDDVA